MSEYNQPLDKKNSLQGQLLIILDYDFSVHDPNLDLWTDDLRNSVFIRNGEPNRIGVTEFPTNVVIITLPDGSSVNGTITNDLVQYTDPSGSQDRIF